LEKEPDLIDFLATLQGDSHRLWTGVTGWLEAIVAGKPDAITMHKGIAASAWKPHAGKLPLIIQGIIARPDDSALELIAEPLDAICLEADAFAVAAFVRGATTIRPGKED
jgi:DhnA family fructose-bisphosphate aldolase class Ia